MSRRLAPVGLALACVLLLGVGTGAGYAGGLITGKQIAKNAITSPKIKNKTIKPADLSKAAKATMTGKPGKTGPRGFSAWDTIPSGVTVTGRFYEVGRSGSVAGPVVETVNLPARAPAPIEKLGLAGSPGCSGSYSNPTAEPGHVCVYMPVESGLVNTSVRAFDNPAQHSYVWYILFAESAANTTWWYWGSWAYTAP